MKYFYIAILAILFMACSRSNYQHSKTKESVLEQSHHQEQKVLNKQTEETETSSTQEDTETESVKIEFDTDKPTNPDTGLPPVKNVTYTNSKKKETGSSQKKGTTQAKETSHTESDQVKKRELEIDTQEESVTEPQEPGFIRILVCVLATVGFSVLYYFIRKNWNRIKKIWKK